MILIPERDYGEKGEAADLNGEDEESKMKKLYQKRKVKSEKKKTLKKVKGKASNRKNGFFLNKKSKHFMQENANVNQLKGESLDKIFKLKKGRKRQERRRNNYPPMIKLKTLDQLLRSAVNSKKRNRAIMQNKIESIVSQIFEKISEVKKKYAKLGNKKMPNNNNINGKNESIIEDKSLQWVDEMIAAYADLKSIRDKAMDNDDETRLNLLETVLNAKVREGLDKSLKETIIHPSSPVQSEETLKQEIEGNNSQRDIVSQLKAESNLAPDTVEDVLRNKFIKKLLGNETMSPPNPSFFSTPNPRDAADENRLKQSKLEQMGFSTPEQKSQVSKEHRRPRSEQREGARRRETRSVYRKRKKEEKKLSTKVYDDNTLDAIWDI